jgi:hypothetical protein
MGKIKTEEDAHISKEVVLGSANLFNDLAFNCDLELIKELCVHKKEPLIPSRSSKGPLLYFKDKYPY